MRIEREIVSSRERNWRLERDESATSDEVLKKLKSGTRKNSPRDRLLKLKRMCHNVSGDSFLRAIAIQWHQTEVNGPELDRRCSVEQQKLSNGLLPIQKVIPRMILQKVVFRFIQIRMMSSETLCKDGAYSSKIEISMKFLLLDY